MEKEIIYKVEGENDGGNMTDFGREMVRHLTTENFHPISTIGDIDIYLVNLQLILSNGDILTYHYKCNWPSPTDTHLLIINNNFPIDLGDVEEYHSGIDILKHYQDFLKTKV